MALNATLVPYIGAALLVPVGMPPLQSQDDTASITVTAPRAGQWSSDGVPTETVAHSIKVSMSDLDLSTAAGQSAAETRIRAAARKSCDWLDAHYPVTDSDKDCERAAVDAAMTRARAIGARP